MNKLYILAMIFFVLVVPIALALETSVIKTEIDVTWDDATKIFTIQGENLDWSRTLNTSGISTTLEILMARDFGNYSEVTALMKTCRDNLNYTDKWETCTDTLLEVSISKYSMVNKTIYDVCQTNLTTCQSDKELEALTITNSKDKVYQELKGDLEDEEQKNSILIIIAIVGAIGNGYFIKKYRIWEKKEGFIQRDAKSEKPTVSY